MSTHAIVYITNHGEPAEQHDGFAFYFSSDGYPDGLGKWLDDAILQARTVPHGTTCAERLTAVILGELHKHNRHSAYLEEWCEPYGDVMRRVDVEFAYIIHVGEKDGEAMPIRMELCSVHEAQEGPEDMWSDYPLTNPPIEVLVQSAV